MKDFNDISSWTEKKLRTLRNNLNNRLESFKKDGDAAKVLQASHKLYGLTEKQCKDLLDKVRTTLSGKK